MRKKKNLIIVSMLMIVAIMSIGYAYFATTLNITTTGNISSAWNVKFTNMSAGDANGTKATSISSSYTDTTATMSVDLKEPGDEMTYELTLTNLGDITAVIEDINVKAEGSQAIIFSIDGLKVKDTLTKNQSKTIKVKIEFDKSVTSQPSETTKTLTLSIRAVQLVDQDTSNPTNPSIDQPVYLGTQILRDNTPKSDARLDFSKPSTYTLHKEVHSTSTESITMSATNIYFGKGYTFDEFTGTYTLTETIHKKWSSMSSSYNTYPYTCNTSVYVSSCKTLYKMTGYTNTTTGVGYKYTSEVIKSVDNGNGLYYTNYNTQNNGTTYYYRGDVDNNYVNLIEDVTTTEIVSGGCTDSHGHTLHDYNGNMITESSCVAGCIYDGNFFSLGNFMVLEGGQTDAEYCDMNYGIVETPSWSPIVTQDVTTQEVNSSWRIVRINEDGSIRLVLADTIEAESFSDETHDYLDYPIVADLDDWYSSNLSNVSGLLADPGFCFDTSIYSQSTTVHDEELGMYDIVRLFEGYNRLEKLYKPKFSCSSSNLYKTSGTGSNKLTNPIGLLTADEVAYAGGSTLANNDNYYLYNGEKVTTMTIKQSFENELAIVYPVMYTVDSNGMIGVIDASWGQQVKVRPVINLKSNVEVILNGAGEPGTSTNPYVIKIN